MLGAMIPKKSFKSNGLCERQLWTDWVITIYVNKGLGIFLNLAATLTKRAQVNTVGEVIERYHSSSSPLKSRGHSNSVNYAVFSPDHGHETSISIFRLDGATVG